MLKRLTWLLLALLLFTAPALAEAFEGKTVALHSYPVTSEVSGILDDIYIQIGQSVETDEKVASVKPSRTFASQDGTVSLICANEGDSVNGPVLEIMPVECYTVYCTVDKAYQSVESTLVHAGETVYIKCTADGTHRAIGIIAQIDGEEYRVLTIGGELLVGETVYLYRDEDFTSTRRIGIGTVVGSDTESYEASGTFTRLCVSEGDFVERGQLLYEVDGGEILSEFGGIVSAIYVQPGDTLSNGQIVAEVVPSENIGVEIQVDERTASRMMVGSQVQIAFPEEISVEKHIGTVQSTSNISESGLFTVIISLEMTNEMTVALGMSVSVFI